MPQLCERTTVRSYYAKWTKPCEGIPEKLDLKKRLLAHTSGNFQIEGRVQSPWPLNDS